MLLTIDDLQTGTIIEHYKKKNKYKIICIARHTETLEDMVVYQALYGEESVSAFQMWTRPLTMFLGIVEHKGEVMPRFQLCK